MPKIIIREHDNTKAGTSEYSNFAVVVPGLAKNGVYNSAVFDENGIFECHSQKEFEENIGHVETKESVVASNAQPEEFQVGSSRVKHETIGDLLDAGLLIDLVLENKDDLYVGEAVASANDGHLIYKEDSSTYRLTKLDAKDAIAEGHRTSELFIVKPGKTGTDACTGDAVFCGNQYAYELLGLGYTVLFKLIKAVDANGAPSTEEIAALGTSAWWNALKDRSVYDFRYITTGGFISAGASKEIAKIATFRNDVTLNSFDVEENGRGDCIALIDVEENASFKVATSQKEAVQALNAAAGSISDADKFSAFFAPKVCYEYASEKYENNTFPASFHYLACMAHSTEDLGYNEWYAASGFERGVSKFKVIGTTYKFGEIAVNALQPRCLKSGVNKSINLIIKIRDIYYLWGNRTAHLLADENAVNGDLVSSHFLNIRQLCTTLKKQIYLSCRRFTFEPNSTLLWNRFVESIRPTLEAMKGDQGIKDYAFVKVADSRKALLVAKIKIVPIEAIEDFDIDVVLEDSISGITAEVTD